MTISVFRRRHPARWVTLRESFSGYSRSIITIELCDVVCGDGLRADRFTFIVVTAVAKTSLVHRFDHPERTAIFFRFSLRELIEMGGLGADKEHGAGILACGHAGAASDAGCRVKCTVGIFLGDRKGIGIRCRAGSNGNETSCLDNPVEGAAVDYEVSYDRERSSAEGFNPDGVTVAEMAHVQLAGSSGLFRSVRNPINCERAHAADALTAIVIKMDRASAFCDDLLVYDIEHFQEGGLGGDVLHWVDLNSALGVPVFLSPDFKREIHLKRSDAHRGV